MTAVPPIPPVSDSRVGAVLNGRYRIVAELARGSMGTVYRAERLGIGRAVAVKFLRVSIVGDRQFTKRFEREALAMSRLSHPHCVPVIDFGVVDHTPYVVMDLVEGRPLSEILDGGAIDPARAIRLAAQILAGLEHTHERGIVHRDVKPANIIVTDYPGVGEHARLVDFGLAKKPRLTSDLTETQIADVTPTYMSPEQSRGDMVDPRTDVYGVGVLLFRMLTGKRPFDADDTATMLLFHREAPIPSLSARSTRTFSTALEDVVATALAKEPGMRFASALAFSEALARVPEAGTLETPRPPRKKSRLLTRTRLLYAPLQTRTAAILAVGCIAVAVFATLRTPNKEAPLTLSKTVEEPAPAAEKTASPLSMLVPVPIPLPAPVESRRFVPPVIVGPAPEPESEKIVGPELPTVVTLPSATTSDLLPEDQGTQAIEALENLRKAQPESAYLPYLLGRLYSERGEHLMAVKNYRDALKGRREYRRHPRLNRALIRALGSPVSRYAAQRVILHDVKRAAVPYLVRAKKNDPDPAVRVQAERLLTRIRSGS